MLKAQQASLENDWNSIRQMENLVVEADKTETQLKRKQSQIELIQQKHINHFCKKNSALELLASE